MDDLRFDSLAKAFAGGASRRSVLKGLLGLGGVLAAPGATEAARRPTPTPTPIKCPGNQAPVDGVCTCPAGLSQCNPGTGPACCNDTAVAPGSPTYSECCDNACCTGVCYGEELCCPWPDVFCAVNNECCTPDKHQCCGAAGCCDHECCPGPNGTSLCCEGDTPRCCPGDACIAEGGCCDASDCGAGACWSCVDHRCVADSAKCAGGCVECIQGACQAVDANCDDGDPCTIRSTCNSDGTCTPTARDCRIPGCGCVAGDACHPAICDQNTGGCNETFDCSAPGCCIPSNMCFQSICDGNLCRETLYCSNDELTDPEADSCCAEFGNPDPVCLHVVGEACTTICPSGLGFVQADNGCCFQVYCDCCTKYAELGILDFGDCLGSCEFSPS